LFILNDSPYDADRGYGGIFPLMTGGPLRKAGAFARGRAEAVSNNVAHATTHRGRRAASI
jgi:hypothetical protein